MKFIIRMGIPEMQELWSCLQRGFKSKDLNRDELKLYKKWGHALKNLSISPFYPSLKTHEIEELSQRYGMKVWQSYIENRTHSARRMFWVYGPDEQEITIIGLEPHPEISKHGVYKRIRLSNLPK